MYLPHTQKKKLSGYRHSGFYTLNIYFPSFNYLTSRIMLLDNTIDILSVFYGFDINNDLVILLFIHSLDIFIFTYFKVYL